MGRDVWQDLCPIPNQLSPWAHLKRLFWNPSRNEELFLASLSERLTIDPTPTVERLLQERVIRLVPVESHGDARFRLVFVDATGQDVRYTSQARSP